MPLALEAAMAGLGGSRGGRLRWGGRRDGGAGGRGGRIPVGLLGGLGPTLHLDGHHLLLRDHVIRIFEVQQERIHVVEHLHGHAHNPPALRIETDDPDDVFVALLAGFVDVGPDRPDMDELAGVADRLAGLHLIAGRGVHRGCDGEAELLGLRPRYLGQHRRGGRVVTPLDRLEELHHRRLGRFGSPRLRPGRRRSPAAGAAGENDGGNRGAASKEAGRPERPAADVRGGRGAVGFEAHLGLHSGLF